MPKMLVGREKVTLFLGNFGSGKTEVAVNFAIHVADGNLRDGVTIVDLDLVNPYFRSREPGKILGKHGVRVVIPETQYFYADLPILIPEVRSLLVASTSYVILDVGGDDIGARVLGALHDALPAGSYRALMVLNASRPFTNTVKGIIKIKKEIEEAGKIAVTGFVSNTHLMGETTVETVISGYRLARQIQDATGIPLEFVSAPEEIAGDVRKAVPEDVLAITRYQAPVWDSKKNEQETMKRGKALFKI
jgi:MinD-like ATPase involved in chromosome partitioning or flagellar assembly